MGRGPRAVLDIQFQIGGRRLEPCFIGDGPEKVALLDAAQRIRRRFAALRIPDREDPLQVLVRGDDVMHLYCELRGSSSVMRQIRETIGVPARGRLGVEI